MPGNINYKSKYIELRSKYMDDLDMAFRLGFEQGQQQAQNDQMAQAQQQQQEMEQAAQQAGQPGFGQDGQPQDSAPEQGSRPEQGSQPEQPSQSEQPGEQPGGSELDQHISKLESMIAKSEDAELKKSFQSLLAVRKSEKLAIDMKKSEMAIKGIAKALHKPAFKLGVQATHNLSSSAKQAVTLQHKIVQDVLAKMEEEEKRAAKDISNILSVEGLLKKE